MDWLAIALLRMGAVEVRLITIGERSASNWVCLSQSGGASEASGAGGELGDGVHDEC